MPTNCKWLSSASVIFALLLATFAIFHLTREIRHFAAHYNHNDLVDYYGWGVDHNLGRNVWTDPPGGQIRPGHQWYPCNYTPFFVLTFAPLAHLSFERTYAVWQAIQLVSLLTALVLLTRAAGPPLNFTWTIVFISLALTSEPVQEMLRWAQTIGTLLLAMTLALIGARKRRAPITGFGLALGTLIKLYPGLLIGAFLLRRRWSEIIWTAVFFAAGVAATGIHNWVDFFIAGRLLARIAPYNHLSASVLATAQEWVSLPDRLSRLRWPVILTATAIFDLSILLACAWATLKPNGDDASSALAFSLWIAAGVLLSPLAWIHDLVLLAPLALFGAEVWYRKWSNPARTFGMPYNYGSAIFLAGLILGEHRPRSIDGFWIGAFIFAGATLILKSSFDERAALS